MRNEEILEAEKLIVDMRNDLALIAAGTTDADKLPALVLEKVSRVFNSLHRVGRHIPLTIVSGQDRDWWFNYPLSILLANAEMAERRPDYKARLLDAVANNTPLVEANLDKVAQVLKEIAPK